MLEKQHASGRNLLFGSTDTYAMQAAFDPKWDSPVPFTVLLSPEGKVLYWELGEVDILKLRRIILGNLARSRLPGPSCLLGWPVEPRWGGGPTRTSAVQN